LLYNSGFQESYKSQRSPTSYSLNLLFLILLDFFTADWEWVWAWKQGIWISWSCIYDLGCTYGYFDGYRGSMGYVQGVWCPRPSGKKTSIFPLNLFHVDGFAVEVLQWMTAFDINKWRNLFCCKELRQNP
jgi:hypothetical protein